jgi:Predicted membrane protein (DUF2254)
LAGDPGLGVYRVRGGGQPGAGHHRRGRLLDDPGRPVTRLVAVVARLLHNLMRDTTNQAVLGTFVATFVYCLLVLLDIRRAVRVLLARPKLG